MLTTEREQLIIKQKKTWNNYRDKNVASSNWKNKFNEFVERNAIWWNQKIRELLEGREESCVDSFMIVYNRYETECKKYYKKTLRLDMRMDEIEWVISLDSQTKALASIMRNIRKWRNSLAHGQISEYPPVDILKKTSIYCLKYLTLNDVYDYFFG